MNNNKIKKELVKDKQKWDEIISSFTANDIYFTHNYFVPFRNNGDGEPYLYYLEFEGDKVAYPFMLRDIADCKKLKNIIGKNEYFDISTVYGYGGPLVESHKNQELNLQKVFCACFSNFCNDMKIVSQFDRFHPLFKNHVFFEGYSELVNIKKTVHIELDNEANIWINMEPRCRNVIRKAQKHGVVVVIDDQVNTINDFKKIYFLAMNSKKASDYYYFNDNFFDDSINVLRDNIMIANVYYEDKIIASAIILRNSEYIHYHFSGALFEYKDIQATSLLIYEVAKWGHYNGYKKFHLGGGYESRFDSLYKFKKSFSKLDDNDFFIGKRIHDSHNYKKLTALNCESNVSMYFPLYRA